MPVAAEPHESERYRDHEHPGRERADEVHETVARARVGVAGRREHEHDRGQRDRERKGVVTQERAPVGHERTWHTTTRSRPIGNTIGGVGRLPEPDEERGGESPVAPPARDAEQEQRGTPRERLLAEQQRLDDRRVGEHGRGPPAFAQLRETRRTSPTMQPTAPATLHSVTAQLPNSGHSSAATVQLVKP